MPIPERGWSDHTSDDSDFGAQRMMKFSVRSGGRFRFAFALLPSMEEMSEFVRSEYEPYFTQELIDEFVASGVIKKLRLDSLCGRHADDIPGYPSPVRPYSEFRPVDLVGLWRDAPEILDEMASNPIPLMKNAVPNTLLCERKVEARVALQWKIGSLPVALNPFALSLMLTNGVDEAQKQALILMDEAGVTFSEVMAAFEQFAEHPHLFVTALALLTRASNLLDKLPSVIGRGHRYRLAWMMAAAAFAWSGDSRIDDKLDHIAQLVRAGHEPRDVVGVCHKGATSLAGAASILFNSIDDALLSSLRSA
jgi:hypothetical protein